MCVCAGTDEGVVVATGRAWMKRGWRGGLPVAG